MNVAELIEALQSMREYDRQADVVMDIEGSGCVELHAIYIESESIPGGSDVHTCILSTNPHMACVDERE